MSKLVDTRTRWLPRDSVEREMVLRELSAIVSSHHFKSSKRYPALLRYVVEKTLDGHSEELKERTLGVEVFERSPDYDTSADPVVRFTAGEIRKRIAQFYHENGRQPELQIDLPPGSYVPEFKPAPLFVVDTDAHSVQPAAPEPKPAVSTVAEKHSGLSFKSYSAWAAALLLAITALGAYAIQKYSASSITDRVWRPLLRSPGSTLIVLGNGLHDTSTPADPARELRTVELHGAYNRVSVCDAVAVSRLAAVLGQHSKIYEVKESSLVSLQDLRQRSVILIGAYNNPWTMRLMEPLQFHFVGHGHGVDIVDTANPANREWTVDYSQPHSSAYYDYAVVARYTDPTTHGSILIIAGVGAYGTQAASEAVSTPSDLKNLLAKAPSGWEDKNLEMVIRTVIVNGEASPASLVALTTW